MENLDSNRNFCTCLFITGTSIGFKNIASKIAYDLRLWLGSIESNDQPSRPIEIQSVDDTKSNSDAQDAENQPNSKHESSYSTKKPVTTSSQSSPSSMPQESSIPQQQQQHHEKFQPIKLMKQKFTTATARARKKRSNSNV